MKSARLPWPFPSPQNPSRRDLQSRISALFWRVGSRVVLTSATVFGGIWLRYLNKYKIYNEHAWVQLVSESRPSRPVLSISNHASCLDDVLLHGLLPRHVRVTRPFLLRWTLAAEDVAFQRPFHALYFALGQTVPVIRGNGVYQRGVDFVIEKLDQFRYVHVYPEGKVNVTDEWLRFKWGVARIVAEARVPPIVIPIWHEGFEEILPNHPPYFPRVGKRVTIVIGTPIDTEPLLRELRGSNRGEGRREEIKASKGVDRAVAEGAEDFFEKSFRPEEEKKILELYGLKNLSGVEWTRKMICDHLEKEMKKLKIQTRKLHVAECSE